MDDLRDGQNLFFLELSSHYLKPYWCAVVDIWVISLPVALISLATGLIVSINGIKTFVSLRDRNRKTQLSPGHL